MISRAELLLLLNAADRLDNVDSIESLFDRGLIAAITEGDSIIAIQTTIAGDAKLRSMTLSPTTA